MICFFWTLYVISMSVRVEHCPLWWKLEDYDFRSFLKFIFNVSDYDIWNNVVLLYQLFMKFYTSWFGVLKKKSWVKVRGCWAADQIQEWKCVPTSKEHRKCFVWILKTNFGENLVYVVSFLKSYHLALAKLIWSWSALWSEGRCSWCQIWGYDLWRAMDFGQYLTNLLFLL